MIEFYTWATPNGRKISIALEEMALPYQVHAINIGKGDQHTPEFLAVSPNNKIPAIQDGGISMFESGSILLYLARKSGRFLDEEGSSRYWDTLQWLMWQMGGFGPMLGQTHHFLKFNPGVSEYAEQRFFTETQRLYKVLDHQLASREFVAGELSVADFSIWPWASRFDYQQIDLRTYPNVLRWYRTLAERPGFQKGYAVPDATASIPMP